VSPLAEDRDIVVSAERTNLAWNRSGLSLLACLAIVARRFFPLDTRGDHVAALLLLGVGGAGWALTLFAGRRAKPVPPGSPQFELRLRVATISTVAIAVAAFALGLFPPE
jgi:hypothetical protein